MGYSLHVWKNTAGLLEKLKHGWTNGNDLAAHVGAGHGAYPNTTSSASMLPVFVTLTLNEAAVPAIFESAVLTNPCLALLRRPGSAASETCVGASTTAYFHVVYDNPYLAIETQYTNATVTRAHHAMAVCVLCLA